MTGRLKYVTHAVSLSHEYTT